MRDLDSCKVKVDCEWVLQEEMHQLLVGCQAEGKDKDTELIKSLNGISIVWCNSFMFHLCYGGSPYGQFVPAL